MTKAFLKRAGAAPDAADSLLPPLPPGRSCAQGTFYMDPEEYAALKVLLAELNRDAKVRVSVATFLRLAVAAVKPRLEDLVKERRLRTKEEVYAALLGRESGKEGG